MLNILPPDKKENAWVIFTGKTDIFWLNLLKPGFRHCFVLLHDGNAWITIDPLSSYTDIQVYHHLESKFNLPAWLKEQGYTVVPYIIEKNISKAAPWSFFTCVEAVKRIIGLHACLVITPWQLYSHLHKNTNKYRSDNMKGNSLWA